MRSESPRDQSRKVQTPAPGPRAHLNPDAATLPGRSALVHTRGNMRLVKPTAPGSASRFPTAAAAFRVTNLRSSYKISRFEINAKEKKNTSEDREERERQMGSHQWRSHYCPEKKERNAILSIAGVSLRRVLWLKKGTLSLSFPIWWGQLWPAQFWGFPI